MTTPPPQSPIHEAVAAYYGSTLAAHGPTARGVDWRDGQSQQLRHRQFDRLIAGDADATVADLGCGYGDYAAHLRAGGHRGRYVGYDLVPDMIAAAERLHAGDENCAWRTGSVPGEPADYVVASGIFNVKREFPADAWERYVDETVAAMAQAGRKGFGFNMLTSWSDADKRRPDLYYGDPAHWFDRCARRFGRHVAVLQDYGLYEFTLLVRTSPSPSHTASPNPSRP
jgi:SAM-dependent methyltransferase